MQASSSSILWLVPAVLLACSLPAVWLARRGRRVDDHPLCRRCGFDQTGKPAGSTVCAECGADLTAPRAIRVGHRQPRLGWLAAATAVLLVSTAWLGLAGYARFADVNWVRHMPTGWLVRDAKGTDAAARDAALGEVVRRIKDGALPQSRVDEVADLGLAHQADRSAVWVPGWGHVVEAARAAGKLSDERWARYRRQAGQFTLDVRPMVRRGDPIPVWVRQGPTRLGAAQFWRTESYGRLPPSMSYSKPGDALEVDGRPVPEYRSGGSSGGTMGAQYGGGSSGTNVDLPPRLLAELPDGPHDLLFRVRVAVSDGTAEPREGDPATVTEVLELHAPFTLVPADRPTVTLNADPSHRPGVEKALTVRQIRLNTQWRPPPGGLDASIDCNGSPIGLAYEVFARKAGGAAGDREWRIGSVNFDANRNSSYGIGTSGKELAGFDADRVDVLFRPSLPTAVRSTKLTQIWDGEVVVKNVPVVKTPAAVPTPPKTQPAATAPAVTTTRGAVVGSGEGEPSEDNPDAK